MVLIEDEHLDKLKEQDYQMDQWLKGNLLIYNTKYDAETFAKRSRSQLVRALVSMDIKK